MKPTLRQFKHLWAMLCLLFLAVVAFGQPKQAPKNKQINSFARKTAEANIIFTLPAGFKEIKRRPADQTFDYGMEVPSADFEVWFSVRSHQNLTKYYGGVDSAYVRLGKDQVRQLSSDNDYFVRDLDDQILSQFNADAGRSYLINLKDSPEARHFKYALIFCLQKQLSGTIVAVCLTNYKGPEFFKTLRRAQSCIRFKS